MCEEYLLCMLRVCFYTSGCKQRLVSFLFYLVVEISEVIVRLTIEYLLIAIREKHVVKLRMNISSHLYKKLFSENPFVVSKNPGEYTS